MSWGAERKRARRLRKLDQEAEYFAQLSTEAGRLLLQKQDSHHPLGFSGLDEKQLASYSEEELRAVKREADEALGRIAEERSVHERAITVLRHTGAKNLDAFVRLDEGQRAGAIEEALEAEGYRMRRGQTTGRYVLTYAGKSTWFDDIEALERWFLRRAER